MKRTPKIPDLMRKVKEHLETGRYQDTFHAAVRKIERKITLPHILHVLRNGYHEKKKDAFKPEYNNWTYAIRGYTIDSRDIRIAVAFDEDDMLIITAIVITRGPK